VTVLVLAEELDLTADRVVAELTRRAVPVFRTDLGCFPTAMDATFSLDGGHGRWRGELRTPHRKVALADVRSIWYRSPTAFQFPEELSAPERSHAEQEAKFGIGGVLGSLDVLWINHPAKEADAIYKPRQLAVAERCGLNIPKTCVTNNPTAVRRFAARCGGLIVVKTMGSSAIAEGDELKVAYTHPVNDAELADLTGVELTAHMFQAWVDKRCEVRLTAVGDTLFAAEIHADSDAARTDWRSDMNALSYRSVDIPHEVAAGVSAYLATFKIFYGAFDFVVRPDDAWIFLECNPGGQYGWIEGHTGLPITTAIVDLLERGRP
jgi:ATP-grasp ribosomal peptide maturase